MTITLTILITLITIAGLALIRCLVPLFDPRRISASNEAGSHMGCITRKVEEAVATRFLLAKVGTVEETDVGICDATDRPIGLMTDAGPTIGDRVAVQLGSKGKTLRCIADKAITAKAIVYTAAGGEVTDVPVIGCYQVGRALTTATTGQFVEVDPVGFGRPYVIKGVHTMSGTGTSYTLDVPGIALTDTVLVTVNNPGTAGTLEHIHALPDIDGGTGTAGAVVFSLLEEDGTTAAAIDGETSFSYMIIRNFN